MARWRPEHRPPEPDRWPVLRPAPTIGPPRYVGFERVKLEAGPLWTDEHGNVFRDERLLDPMGLVVVRMTEVDSDER